MLVVDLHRFTDEEKLDLLGILVVVLFSLAVAYTIKDIVHVHRASRRRLAEAQRQQNGDLNAQATEVMAEYENICAQLDRQARMAEAGEFSRIRPPPGNQEIFIAFVRRRIEIVRLVYQVGDKKSVGPE
jgi:hypothetical protein